MSDTKAHGARGSAGLTILHLATDAYGGYGGVALYNRDVIEAMCADPAVRKVVSVARVQSAPLQPLPDKLTYDTSGLGSVSAYLKAVWRQLRANPDIDLVYCAHINLAPVAWAIARLRRVPWMLCIYGIDAWPQYATPRGKFFASRADLVCAVSAVTRDRFRSWCPVPLEKTEVTPNAIHLDEFGIGPKRPDLLARYGLEGAKVIMTFGRLDPAEKYKGFDEIIELMPEMLEERPELRYLIVGKGDDRPRLEAKAAALGVADKVIFTGPIEEEEKADIYRLVDVYAMPSKGEGFGFVVLEALACGVPAIGSNQDGTQEAVRHGMIGQVVDPDNPAQIKAAIFKVIDAPREIPEGLAYFALPAFTARLQGLIHRMVGR
jgi:glycosyltransferase involved in cell wall biosynthesis